MLALLEERSLAVSKLTHLGHLLRQFNERLLRPGLNLLHNVARLQEIPTQHASACLAKAAVKACLRHCWVVLIGLNNSYSLWFVLRRDRVEFSCCQAVHIIGLNEDLRLIENLDRLD